MANNTNSASSSTQLEQAASSTTYQSYDGMPVVRPSRRVVYFQAPHRHAPTDMCTPMDIQDVHLIWNASKTAAWMLDVVLLDAKENTLRASLWNRFFKTAEHEKLVIEILELAREFIDAFLTYDDSRLACNVKMVRLTNRDPGSATVVAGTSVHPHPTKLETVVFSFYDFFFQDQNELCDLFLTQLEPSYAAERMSTYHAPKTVIHEVIHFVSRRATWTKLGQGPPGSPAALPSMPIHDVRCAEFANQASANDQNIVGKWTIPKGSAYGPEACRDLAKLDNGAVATLYNADSYAIFVNEYILTHLFELTDGPDQIPPPNVREDICRVFNYHCYPSWRKSIEPEGAVTLGEHRPRMARLLLGHASQETLDFIHARRETVQAIMQDDIKVRRVPMSARKEWPFFFIVTSTIPPIDHDAGPDVTSCPPYVSQVDPFRWSTHGSITPDDLIDPELLQMPRVGGEQAALQVQQESNGTNVAETEENGQTQNYL